MALRRTEDKGRAELDRSIAAARRVGVPEARLAPDSRARILRELRQSSGNKAERGAWGSLFVPTSRLALGAALPLAALSVVAVIALTLQTGLLPVPGDSRPSATHIEATKVGSEVVFVIRNGGSSHALREASDPLGFRDEVPVRTVEGRFRDSLETSAGIVYYRID